MRSERLFSKMSLSLVLFQTADKKFERVSDCEKETEMNEHKNNAFE